MDAQGYLLLSIGLSRLSGGSFDWERVQLLHKSELNIVALDGFRKLLGQEGAIAYDHTMGTASRTSSSKRVGSKDTS
jgi:hypothetical protein